jgi:hypothetical protein
MTIFRYGAAQAVALKVEHHTASDRCQFSKEVLSETSGRGAILRIFLLAGRGDGPTDDSTLRIDRRRSSGRGRFWMWSASS